MEDEIKVKRILNEFELKMPILDETGLEYYTQKINELFATKKELEEVTGFAQELEELI